MDKEEKIRKCITEKNIGEILSEEISVEFIIPGKPENYVRERSGRGKHFYNPKEGKMREYKMLCLKQLSKEEHTFIKNTISECNDLYTVEIEAEYYYPIPKGDSIKMSVLKEVGLIHPTVRIDIDNYDKFILDSLHDVLYDDDKHVVSIKSIKRYSLEPKTIVRAKVISRKIK